jgi:hypothetical protein
VERGVAALFRHEVGARWSHGARRGGERGVRCIKLSEGGNEVKIGKRGSCEHVPRWRGVMNWNHLLPVA